jgi:hypothetical protein
MARRKTSRPASGITHPTPLANEPKDFATLLVMDIYCSWRDGADYDYIAARSAYQAELWGPFYWSALQAVEKYLKTILLLAGHSTIPFGHDLPRLLSEARKAVPALNQIESADVAFVTHLHAQGQNRYLTRQRIRKQHDLYFLDRLVRRLRMYCSFTAWESHGNEPPLIARPLPSTPREMWQQICRTSVEGGVLERVLARKGTAGQRRLLVWRNALYCSRPLRLLQVGRTTWGWTNARVGLSRKQIAWLDARVKR